jgi:lysozyme
MAATSRGLDVSSYQGPQDWAALVRGGVTYAAAKASEGEHTHDPRYRMHMDGMRGAGVLPQGYHYAWPNQSARAEADNYLAAVHADASEVTGYVHWLDLERRTDGRNYAGMSAAGIRAYAEAWVDRVKAAFPRQRVGCYTSADDITHGHYPRNSDFLFYPAYPSGPLNWTQAEQRSRPRPGGMTPLFWQFASSPTDRSIAYMTPAAYKAWAGHQEVPDVQLSDKLTIPAGPWNDKPMTATFGEWVGFTNLKADAAVQGVRQLTAMVGALTGMVAKLAADNGHDLTAEQISDAAEAGANKALATGVVHVQVTGVPVTPADAKPAQG